MNAIILAAGMGTRLRPLTNEMPKCLVPVLGIPIVERQIQFLHEAGIRDITLVSGYRAEKLSFLIEKYGVRIVYNERYDTCNNIYSLYKVLDVFGDTWVVEGDVYMQMNCFTTNIRSSAYYAKWHRHYEREWGLECDTNGKLINIHIGNGQGCIMSGISYWNRNDAKLIADEIRDIINSGDYTNLFWDEAVVHLYKRMNIEVKAFNYIHEIDTEKELTKLEQKLRNDNERNNI